MSLSREYFSEINREYSDRRLANARLLDERKKEISQKIPEYDELNRQINALRINNSIAVMSSDDDQTPDGSTGESQDNVSGGFRSLISGELQDLISQRNDLLTSNGYPLDYLSPIYTCHKCKDTGYIGSQKCDCLKERISQLIYNSSQIHSVLEYENFSTYNLEIYSDKEDSRTGLIPREVARDAGNTAVSFIKNFDDSSDNLFIYGETGTGKTFLSNCIARTILDKGCSVVYLSSIRLFRLLADAAFGSGTRTDEGLIDDLYGCDLLIIDDLGTEMSNSFTGSELFGIINERILSGKHTIISTNLSLDQIKDKYSERIFSRIASNYIMVKLIGEDIRIKKKLEG